MWNFKINILIIPFIVLIDDFVYGLRLSLFLVNSIQSP